MWQDIAISCVSILFTVFLIPQIRSSMKGNHADPWTSGLTAIGLYVMAGVYVTLGLWFSAVISIITATAWAGIWGMWDRDNA